MAGSFGRWSVLLYVAAVGLSLQLTDSEAQAQATLPAGWQQMSPTDFAAEIRTLFDQGTFKQLSITDEEAAKAQGKKLFLQMDISNTQLGYQTIEMLHWVTRNDLDPSVVTKTRQALLSRQDNWAGQPYAELRAKVAMMYRLKAPEPSMMREAQRWVQAGGKIGQVPAADLVYAPVRQMFYDMQLVNGPFSVQWEGLLNPPQTGGYEFSISPININAGFSPDPVNIVMTVSVGGQVVLNSNPSKPANPNPAKPANPSGFPDPSNWVNQSWVYQSDVVNLTAGQSVPIKVIVSVNAKQKLPSSTLHAMLFWKPPGKVPSIVPNANLTLADNSGPGLKATYTWTANDQPQTLVRTDPNIDFAWTNRPILLTKNVAAVNQSSDTMFQAVTSAPFIAGIVGPPVTLHPLLQQPDESSAAVTTAQRSAFLDLLLQNPAMLDPMDAKQAVRFFHPFRVGAPDKALDVFGTWAVRNPDVVSDLSTDRVYNGDQRFAFASMAIFTTQQLSYQAADLQNNYLTLADGRCSLPVAYTLACSYLGRKKFADWVALLDAKLAEPAVTGDLRVNWLLARANAQELDPRTATHYPSYYAVPFLRPLYGRDYLDQALKAAVTPAVKVRVAREISSRLAWSRDFQSAKAVLQSITPSLPNDQKTVVAGLQQQLDDFVTIAQQTKKNQPALAKQSYVSELKNRRDQAAKRGDAANTARYDNLINSASNANK